MWRFCVGMIRDRLGSLISFCFFWGSVEMFYESCVLSIAFDAQEDVKSGARDVLLKFAAGHSRRATVQTRTFQVDKHLACAIDGVCRVYV